MATRKVGFEVGGRGGAVPETAFEEVFDGRGLLEICFWMKAVESAGLQTGGEESGGVAMNADFIQEPRQGAGVDAPQQRPQLYPNGNRRVARQFVPRLQERLMNEC